MKYIILSKNLNEGIKGNDSSNLNSYFELGWEVVGSRIDFIAELNKRNIDEENTTVVTIKDRMFLYTKIFKNVISYEDFKNITLKNEDSVEDWVKNFKQMRFLNAATFVQRDTKKYFRHEEDRDTIFNGYQTDGEIKTNGKYFVLGIRLRDHCSHRNSDLNFYEILVKLLKTITPNIFVVGKSTEQFCKENDCFHLEKLKDFADLIKREECISFIGQSTGTMLLAFCAAECPIHLIDSSKASDVFGDNAVLGGKCVQFTKNTITPHYSFSHETAKNIYSNCLEIVKR